MIKVYQDLTLANNNEGNCFGACIASILEIPLKDMPQFSTRSAYGVWEKNWKDWLEAKGYKLVTHMPSTPPRGYSIASGYSSRTYPKSFDATKEGKRVCHATVAFDGFIVHDPFPLPGNFDSIFEYQTIEKVEE